MRVSLKWLSEYVDLRLPPDELAHVLTMAGLAVDTITRIGDWGPDIRVGHVADVRPHPNADRLRLATVDLGSGERHTVVCGAPNVAAGQKIAFATAGARVRDGHTGKNALLKPAVIRGVESAGMVLSERELGLSEEHEGILELSPDAPVGAALVDVLGDVIFDVSVTPNRPDWLSVLGIAREVAALTGVSVREPSLEYTDAGPPIAGRAFVDISDPDLCRRYIATLIEGITIGPSPDWMQVRLRAIGQRPINNVVDVTNYVMFELGQPLHAFDYDKIAGHHITVRRAISGEPMRTLDGTQHALTRDMLVIADERGPVALAGVMGGLESEVSEGTTNILLEAANFAGPNVRRTSIALKARSEASARFEKGLPPALVAIASRRATKLLVELCGSMAAAGAVDSYPAPQPITQVEISTARLRQVLGVDVPEGQVRAALTGLGFETHHLPPDRYVASVPYWRPDVRIADDLAEEVARIVGYDQLPTELLSGAIPPETMQPLRELRERVRDVLAAAGMQEIVSYSMTTLAALQRVMPPEELATYPPYRMLNPISADHEYLRTSLRANILQTLASNLRYQHGEVALFETARTYQRPVVSDRSDTRPGAAALPEEREVAVGVLSGRRLDRWGRPGEEGVDFFDAKASVEALFEALGVEAEYVAAPGFGMVPGRAAEIHVDGRRVGVIGQMHPDVAAAFEVEQEVFLFELSIDDLLPATGGPRLLAYVSRYPAVEQDIAIIVPAETPGGALLAAIASAKLVKSARIFDVYTGDQVPAGKKSVAIAISYQSDEHTLTDDEVAKAQAKLVERLRRDFGAELRG